MDARYIVRRIDRSSIELLPDGRMLIWEAGWATSGRGQRGRRGRRRRKE